MVKVEKFPLENVESFTLPKISTSLHSSVEGSSLHHNDLQMKLPVVPTFESANVKNDNMLPNEKREKLPPQEFISNSTTLNFARDTEINVMVLKVKNDDGDVLMQIPEEARLKLARFVRKTYEEPREPILSRLA